MKNNRQQEGQRPDGNLLNGLFQNGLGDALALMNTGTPGKTQDRPPWVLE
jgi:hypothetical protein